MSTFAIRFLLLMIVGMAIIGCGATRRESADEAAARENRIRQLLSQGVLALRASDDDSLEQAEAAFVLAGELDKNDARILDGLGSVAFRRGQLELAEYYFQKAITLDRNYDRPVAHLALVAEARGHHEAARGLLQLALSMNPLNYRARNNRAALDLRVGPRLGKSSRAYADLLEAYHLVGAEDPIVGHNLRHIRERSDPSAQTRE